MQLVSRLRSSLACLVLAICDFIRSLLSDGHFAGPPRTSGAYPRNGADICRCGTCSASPLNDMDCLVTYVARDGSITLHCFQRDELDNLKRLVLCVLLPTSATYSAAACRCKRSVASSNSILSTIRRHLRLRNNLPHTFLCGVRNSINFDLIFGDFEKNIWYWPQRPLHCVLSRTHRGLRVV